MARDKKAKPLFAVKQDFIDSLEVFCMAAIMLQQAIETALELGQVADGAKPTVEKHLAHFRNCMVGKE